MARLVSGRRTPWVRGPSAVVDAYVLGAATDQFDIYFERVVAYTAFLAQGVHAIIDPIGAAIDTVLTAGTAIGAAFSQDVSPSGLLVNNMDFTVLIATTPEGGEVTDTVTVSIQAIHDQGAAGIEVVIQNIVNRLQAAGA